MNLLCRTKLPVILSAFSAILLSSNFLVAQIIPRNENFATTVDINDPVADIHQPGAPSMTYTYGPQIITGPTYMLFGQAPGTLFRPNNSGFYFNYTSTGAIPGAGHSGPGQYRIHFTGLDTTQRLGNFQLKSIYLAIGTGNTGTVTLQGFRAGRIVANSNFVLSSNSSDSRNDFTEISYNGTDAYSGTDISFGTNWTFIDAIHITNNDNSIPLEIDDMVFDYPTTYPPSFQATNISFNNIHGSTAGVNWSSGNGDSTVVFMAKTGSGSAAPPFGSYYTASTVFGNGTQVGASGWFCIYKGTGASATISNLEPGTTYRVMAISFNGARAFEEYNTAAGTNVANLTTAGTLPVHFGEVGAKASNCQVYVSFETLSETSNNHFVIERAKDAGNWDSLTTLKGRGNSASTIQYSYIDQTPLKGKSYYRIRQVDNDNKFQYTKTLAVQDDCGDKQLIKIYPNPARESVQVVLPGSGEQATILVYDIAGRQIFPTIQTNDNAKTINTSGIPGGTYFLKITSGGKVFTRGLTIGK